MQLPTTVPETDPSGLWALQGQLITLAEQLVGQRDRTKTIYQPSFHDDGPRLRNTPTLDGAFVELGRGSKVYWPTVVYEMAHETIHLLNPTVGHTNWLEEGVAVAFSVHAQSLCRLQQIQTPNSGPYFEALELVRALPGGPFVAARRVREFARALNAITTEQLRELFPDTDPVDLGQLSKKCIPR